MRLLHILRDLLTYSWSLLTGYISVPLIRRYLSRKGLVSGTFRKRKTSRYSSLVFTGTTRLGRHWRMVPLRLSKQEALVLGSLLDTSRTSTITFEPGLVGIPASVTLAVVGKDGIPKSPTNQGSLW